MQTESHPMTQESITFHFPKADTSVLLSAFYRLSRNGHNGSGTSSLGFITNHVSEGRK